MDDRIWRYLPTIHDLFVRHGVEFTQFAGESPLCCPGRAGFLTGQHTFNHGVTRNDVRLFDPSVSLATALHDVGYGTFLAGKYFDLYPLIAPSVPPGWEGFDGYAGGYYDYKLWNNGNPQGEYHGTAARDTRPTSSPPRRWPSCGRRRLASASSAGSHRSVPTARTRRLRATWPSHGATRRRLGSAQLQRGRRLDKPQYVQQTPLLEEPAFGITTTCRTLLAVDDLVAGVRDELARQGRLDNTLFVLTTDNGMNAGAHRLLNKGTPYATPLSFYVSWPAALGRDQRTISEPLMNIDLGAHRVRARRLHARAVSR